MISRDVLDLNGWWHIWYDEAAAWESEPPFPPGAPLHDIPRRPPSAGWQGMERGLESLQVPGTWSLSRPGYHGVAWQWRPLFIPEDWQGRVVRLCFEAVRLRAEVFLDEELVGYDLEGYTPFEVDLTEKIRPGRQQELALRITNPGGSISWRDQLPIHWAGRQLPPSHDVGGIWGDVSLIATAPVYIESVHAMPDPGLASVTLRISLARRDAASQATEHPLRLLARIYDPTGNLAAEQDRSFPPIHGARATVDLAIDIPNPQPWTPDHPRCYRAEVLLSGEGFEDTLSVVWGLCRFEARGPHFHLNGEPTLLRAAISWGWYPNNLAFPSVPLAEEEVQNARALGLNALLLCGCPATPRLLQAADRLGLMIVQDPAGVPGLNAETSPEIDTFGSQLALARIRRLARRDRNHPSLVWWRLVDPLQDPSPLGLASPNASSSPDLLDVINGEDPTRLATWGSGNGRAIACNPHATARFGLYDLSQAESTALVWENDRGVEMIALAPPKPGAPLLCGPSARFAALSDLPALVRRYGDRVLPGSDAQVTRDWMSHLESELANQGIQRIFASVSAFCSATRQPQEYAIRRTIEAHRLNPNCSGFAISDWCSTPITGNSGMVDIFRSMPWQRAQAGVCGIAQANAPLTIALLGLPSHIRARDACCVEIWALNETGPQEGLALRWEQRTPDGRNISSGRWPVALGGLGWQERLGQIDLRAECGAPSHVGSSTLYVELSRGERKIASLEERFWVSDLTLPPWPSDGHILDTAGLLSPLIRTFTAGRRPFRLGALPERLCLVSWDSGEDLARILRQAQEQPSRVALLLPETGQDRDQTLAIVTSLLPGAHPRLVPLHHNRFGAWMYGHSHPLLEGVADPGIWDHRQRGLFPRHLIRCLPGDILVGGCAFTMDDEQAPPQIGAPPPQFGAALNIIPWGRGELLFCALPVVSGCQNHLLSAEQLMHNMARWLA